MPPIPGSSRISESSDGAGPALSFAIAPARGAAEIETVRALFGEYRAYLGPNMQLPGYDEEMAGLPGDYAPPSGEILLARDGDGAALGCAVLRALAVGAGEIKRLYVREAARGMGLGRALTLEIEAIARRAGYRELKLDSLPRLVAAISLYRSLGFADVPRYNDNPNPGVVFMGKRL